MDNFEIEIVKLWKCYNY